MGAWLGFPTLRIEAGCGNVIDGMGAAGGNPGGTRVGGCVCSSDQIRKGSHGLFKLGRGLGGIGTVVSGSFCGQEALALVVGHF